MNIFPDLSLLGEGIEVFLRIRRYHHAEYFIQLCFFSSFTRVFKSKIVPPFITDHLTELVSISDALTALAGSYRGTVPAAQPWRNHSMCSGCISVVVC